MAAYFIFDVDVTDPDGYAPYRAASGPSVEQYGGEFLARGGEVTVLEGDWPAHRVVVLRFNDADRAMAWYNSPEYTQARKIRQRTAISKAILVQGV